jgi:hypothetical protein
MTNLEFSNEFDILYNNIMSNAAPGLTEYEKSVFLTQAQEAFILDVYNGNYKDLSLEETEETKRYITTLIKQSTLVEQVDTSKIISTSISYSQPTDVWFIIYESVLLNLTSLGCNENKIAKVLALSHNDFLTALNNPHRGPNEKRVLSISSNNKIEIISKYPIISYSIRFLSKPEPIILTDLTSYNTTINGISVETICKLNPVVHRTILNKAVQLAKSVWTTGM